MDDRARKDETNAWQRFEELTTRVRELERRLAEREAEARTLRDQLADAHADLAGMAQWKKRFETLQSHGRSIAESLFDGVCVYRGETIVELNDALCRMFGYEREEGIGTSILDYFTEESVSNIRAALRGEMERPYIVVGRRRDGSTFHVEVSGRRGALEGEPDLNFVALRDVEYNYQQAARLTAARDELESQVQKRTEELSRANAELRETIERRDEATRLWKRDQTLLRALLDSAPFYIAFKDLRGRYVRVNRATAAWLGLNNPDDAVGKSDADFFPQARAQRNRSDEESIIQSGDVQMNMIEHVRTQDGDVWLSKTLLPWRDSKGEVRGTVTVSHDISNTIRAEQALRDSESKFRALAENAQDGIIRFDRTGRLLYANAVSEHLFGQAPDRIAGKTFKELKLPPDLAKVWRTAIQKVFNEKSVERVEFRLPNGSWFDWLLAPEIGPEGAVETIITAARNVTEYKAAVERAQKSEAYLNSLLKHLPDTVAEVSSDLVYRYLSRPTAGLAVEAVVGKTVGQIALSEHRDAVIEAARRTVSEGVVTEITVPYSRNGHLTWWHTRVIPLDRDGEPRSLLMILSDVTERKTIQDKFEESESRFRSLVENAPDYILIVDRDRTIRFINRTDAERNDFSVNGASVFDFVDEENRARLEDAISRGFDGEVGRGLEIVGTGLSGESRWFSIRFSPLKQGERIDGLIAIATDVSSRKNQEQLLIRSEETGRVLLNASPLAALLADREGRIIAYNERFPQIVGPVMDDYVGVSIFDLMAAEKIGKRRDILSLLIENGEEIRFEDTFDNRLIEISASPVFDVDGRVDRVAVFMTDVTDLRNAMEDLRAALNKAHEADVLKGRFLANVSHEIKTPLNAIIGLTDVLTRVQPNMPPDRRSHYLDLIRRSAESLLLIMNNILKLSRIEAGKLEPELVEFDLHKFLTDLGARYRSQAEAKRLDFRFDLDEGIPRQVVADPVMLEMVLNNLLGNAIKFTQEGFVRLTSRPDKNRDESLVVAFEIEDTGIGIEQRHHAHIFDSFYQVDDSTTRAYQGTGLGLAITKELVQLQGGTIRLSSEPDKGSVFEFDIALKPGSKKFEN